ncbi:MAG: C39 family peptidase [Candidatus Hodarchaeota archaeon]
MTRERKTYFPLVQLIFVILVLVINNHGSISSSVDQDNSLSSPNTQNLQFIDRQSNPNYHVFEVPFRGMERYNGGSGPACLEMIYAYYGDYVSQTEIWLDYGAHYDDFIKRARYDNFTHIEHGYFAEIYSLQNLTREQRWEFVKSYIDQEIPPVLITRRDPPPSTIIPHYRIISGYDERSGVFYVHDPYTGPYHGPYSIMSYEIDEFLEEKWKNAEYRVADIRPINVTLETTAPPIVSNSEFTLSCMIDISMFSSSVNLTLNLSLPEEYTLSSGSENATVLNVVDEIQQSWIVKAPSNPKTDDLITITVTTHQGNYTIGGTGRLYPQRPPPEITSPSAGYENDYVPYEFTITAEITYSDYFSAYLAYYDETDAPRGKIRTYNLEIHQSDPNIVTMALGPISAGQHIICWIIVETQYGNYSSSLTVFKIPDSYQEDTDGDGLSDGEEVYLHQTNPLLADTDGDGMNDKDEIIGGFNPLDSSSGTLTILLLGAVITLIVIIPVIIFFYKKRNKSDQIIRN